MNLEEIEPKFEMLMNEINSLKLQIAKLKRQPPEENYLTTTEVAKKLGVDKRKVDSWRRNGLLKAFQTNRQGRWIYRESDVIQLFDDWNGLDLTDDESIRFSAQFRDIKKGIATNLPQPCNTQNKSLKNQGFPIIAGGQKT